MAFSIDSSAPPSSSTRIPAPAAEPKGEVPHSAGAKGPARSDGFDAPPKDYSTLNGAGGEQRLGKGVQLALTVPPPPKAPADSLERVRTNQGYWVGPFNTSAVHENLSLLTLGKALSGHPATPNGLLASLRAEQLPTDKTTTDVDIRTLPMDLQQWARGSRWPDDPESRLFNDPVGTTQQTMGSEWYSESTSTPSGDGTDVTRRSLNGDLVYLHAMATTAGERPETTQASMVNWTSFLGEVATGRIPPDTRVRENEYLRTVFPNDKQQNLTVRELLSQPGVERADNASTPGRPRNGRSPGTPSSLTDLAVRQRAAGAMLHTVQDSYTDSHAARNGRGEITEFHFYPQQDESQHHQADEWVVNPRSGASAKTLGARVDQMPGARDSVNRGAELLQLLDQGAPAATIRSFLGDQVFKLAGSGELRPAGPGDDYRPNRRNR